jgi:hypothetical protein
MSDKKITDLTALAGANLATGDEFPFTDISDTTMSASGTTKSMTAAELAKGMARQSVLSEGETVVTNAASGAAATVNVANGTVEDLTLTANCTLTFSGSVSGRASSFTLILRQDATGSRTIAWPAAVKWPAGTAPTISTVASRVDVFTFLTVDNGTTWLGFTAGIGVR